MLKISEYIKGLTSVKFRNERSLSDSEIEIAKFLGIKKFAKVKIVDITKEDFKAVLNDEAVKLLDRFGFINTKTNAITLGNRIFFFKSTDERKTIAHELVHIYQYEKLGIDGFVQAYLDEFNTNEKSKKISMEVTAYKFAKEFKANGYSFKNIDQDRHKFISDTD